MCPFYAILKPKEEETAESEPVGDYGSGIFNASASAGDQNGEGSNN